jgi:glycosyltransferase involved in cell wall biosynthesis
VPNPSNMASEPMSGPVGQIWFLASLPPPVNGQANCNAAMWTLLSGNAPLVELSLGHSRIGKIFRSFANSWKLLRYAKRGDAAYISIPGQYGAWLLLPAIAAARARGLTIWFHHHSFRSINRGPMPVMRLLVGMAGPRQNHILLSDSMCDRFAALYLQSGAGLAHAMSNTVLLAPDLRTDLAPRSKGPPTLGHMSVLTREKGVLYLIDLFDELSRHVPGIRLVIAGPATDAKLLAAVHAAQARYPETFEYRGEVATVEKDKFYRDIDFFVLPTTLVDEAEPLVMIEAYARGVDVFATAVGCIPDRIRDPQCILSLDRSADAARIALAVRAISTDWASLRIKCKNYVVQLSKSGEEQGVEVFARLFGSIKHVETEHVSAAPAKATRTDGP